MYIIYIYIILYIFCNISYIIKQYETLLIIRFQNKIILSYNILIYINNYPNYITNYPKFLHIKIILQLL